MAIITEVWVPGHPKTKGSLTFKGNGYVEENVSGSKEWRALVAQAVGSNILDRSVARGELPPSPTRSPVRVELGFWLDHPDPCGPTVRAGDVDKLVRNVLDALTDAGVYVDDNQVASLAVAKLASGGQPGESGVSISVIEMETAELSKLRVLWLMLRKMIRGH